MTQGKDGGDTGTEYMAEGWTGSRDVAEWAFDNSNRVNYAGGRGCDWERRRINGSRGCPVHAVILTACGRWLPWGLLQRGAGVQGGARANMGWQLGPRYGDGARSTCPR